MKTERLIRLPALLCALLVAVPAIAQETAESAAPTPPDVASLDPDWWTYFQGTPDAVAPRIDTFLSEVNREIGGLAPQNQEVAPSIVGAVRDNLEVYVSLLGEVDIVPERLDEPKESYGIEGLFEAAARARDATATARESRGEVERERRVLDGASSRRDALFKEYLNAQDGDARWLAGLRLVRARTAQGIASRRLEILTKSARAAEAFAADATERVEVVLNRLSVNSDENTIEQLDAVVDERQQVLENAIEQQREAAVAASGLGAESAEGRSQQRLAQQRALDADVELASAEIELAKARAERSWAGIVLGEDVDFTEIEDQPLAWSELIRSIQSELPVWQQQTEEELLTAQTINRDGLDRSRRRVLDQRTGTSQETLAHLVELETSIAELDLLMVALDNALAANSNTLEQGRRNAYRTARATWIRITEFSSTTLFSVNELPVTVGDILQGLFILFIGWILSRGIRFAINRVGRRESVGAQASLYTLSRLTHYTIIIVAALIALTSIGLDLGNLALVAGALSVGIGFGLQSIVNNFVSGLIILFERTLRVGDYIELDTGLTGTVKAINVRSTLINTNDNIDIVVPNSEFVSTKLTNWTLGEHILRVRIPFGVAYGSDKEIVRKAAIEACDKVPYTLTHMRGREPDVWLVEYGDNSLNFLLLVWVNRQGARRPTRTRAAYLWALEDKLREYGVEIPFPQRDLHLKTGWARDAEFAMSPPEPADEPEPSDESEPDEKRSDD